MAADTLATVPAQRAVAAPIQPRWLTDREQHTWRSYLHMNSLLTAQMQRDLQADSGLSLADFSVLVELSEHPEERMRVMELAKAVRWEKSRLSHQLARMQQRGLVQRTECSADKRGAFIALTDVGRTTIVAAAPLHVESVRRLMFDVLTPEQVDQLGAISDAVVARLQDQDCADCS